jgi:hypothetical protein
MVAPTLIETTPTGVRARDAGTASGVINTALQLGGAIGVALIGVIFFGLLPEGRQLAADSAGGFTAALRGSLWLEVGIYVPGAALMLLLPQRRSEALREPSPAPSLKHA